MKKFLKVFSLGLMVASSHAHAQEVTQSFNWSSFGFSTIYSSSDAPGLPDRVSEQIVTGINKFDPALGTLTDIQVSVSYTRNETAHMDGFPVPNNPPIFPWSVLLDITTNGLGTGVFYKDGSTYTPVLNFSPTVLACGHLSDPSGLFCFDDIDHLDIMESINDHSIMGAVQVGDFVGTGQVTALTYGHVYPGNAALTLVNADIADTQFQIAFINGTVTVKYLYTPAGIPEVAVPIAYGYTFILAVLVLAAARLARKANRLV